MVQFRKIHVYDMEKGLGQICENEKIKVGAGVLRQLADRSKGDLRSAISDLETVSSGKEVIRLADLDELGFRERETSIFDSMKIIFKTKNVQTAKQAINNVDKDPDEIFWWIENNIASEYESPEEIARAFDILSKADLFRVRTSFRQNWRLKGYMIDLMTGGVALSKKEMYRKFTRYQYPSNIIALGRTKGSRKEMRELLSKLSGQLHCSSRKLRAQYLPFLRIMIKNKKLSKEFASSLNLTKDEMKALA